MRKKRIIKELKLLVNEMTADMETYKEAAVDPFSIMFMQRKFMGKYLATRDDRKKLMELINKAEGKQIYRI